MGGCGGGCECAGLHPGFWIRGGQIGRIGQMKNVGGGEVIRIIAVQMPV